MRFCTILISSQETVCCGLDPAAACRCRVVLVAAAAFAFVCLPFAVVLARLGVLDKALFMRLFRLRPATAAFALCNALDSVFGLELALERDALIADTETESMRSELSNREDVFVLRGRPRGRFVDASALFFRAAALFLAAFDF